MAKGPFQDRVVWITGASRGIGAALARRFTQEGARVALTARSAGDLSRLAEELSVARGQARAFPADVSDTEEIQRAFGGIIETWGRVDVLVNNAGYGVAGFVDSVPLEAFQKNMEVNFFGALRAIQAVLPLMKEARRGLIVNVSSILGKRSVPYYASYCATKFALNALSESLRVELKPWGIDVVSICPGLIETPFHESGERYGGELPLRPRWRGMSADRCARKIVRACRRRPRERIVTFHAWLLATLNRFFPGLVDRLLGYRFRLLLNTPDAITLRSRIPRREPGPKSGE
jgi:NAD(P)-dependent dehydrogenase (short-subunit alcohol dehydrogenase family)